MLTDELRRAYQNTDFHVFADEPLVLRPGETCPDADKLLVDAGQTYAAVLTAWNPRSAETDRRVNEAAQACLEEKLSGLELSAIPAEGRGRDGNWPPEPSLFILGATPGIAQQLAHEFRQAAWLQYVHGEPARIVETQFADPLN